VPNTSTLALTNATFPYLQRLAQLGPKQALLADPGLAEGVNTHAGTLTYEAVAESQGKPWTPIAQLLAS
jgi:alanine dehydrogenase